MDLWLRSPAFFDLADGALYQAESAGRNRVVVAGFGMKPA
jgi:PleD family two-component response regulator